MTGLSSRLGVHGLHRLHRLDRLNRLQRLQRLAPVLDFATVIGGKRTRARYRPRRRQPSIVWLLVAGLAVITLAKVMTASWQQRSKTERMLLAGLLVLLGLVVLSFRRSAARYR
ncbi:hypothetical protein D3C83_29180 [compost metagenome]